MLAGLFLIFSSVWLITIRDVAPIIGVIVLAILIVVLFVIIMEFYRYMVKKGMEQYEREHGRIPPGRASQVNVLVAESMQL